MKQLPYPPKYYAVWTAVLERYRAKGQMDDALDLRRQDAEDHGFDPKLALNEEREWWATHKEAHDV